MRELKLGEVKLLTQCHPMNRWLSKDSNLNPWIAPLQGNAVRMNFTGKTTYKWDFFFTNLFSFRKHWIISRISREHFQFTSQILITWYISQVNKANSGISWIPFWGHSFLGSVPCFRQDLQVWPPLSFSPLNTLLLAHWPAAHWTFLYCSSTPPKPSYSGPLYLLFPLPKTLFSIFFP